MVQVTRFGGEMSRYRVDDLVRQAEAERASRPLREARVAQRLARLYGPGGAIASLVARVTESHFVHPHGTAGATAR